MWGTLFTWASVLILFAGILFLLDRLLLWMESRGWIYWRKSKPSPGTASQAWLNIQAMVEPGKQYVIQEEEKAYEVEDGEAEPDPHETQEEDPETGESVKES